MQQQYLTIWDLVISPFYIITLYFIAKRMRDKRYPEGHPLRPYYLPGLLAKFAGAIFIALIYQYYYGSGDTFNFYSHSKIINSALGDSFEIWVKLLFRTSPETDPYLYKYSSQLYWYNDPSSYTVSIIGAMFGLLNGTTYIPIALLFAYFSFSGLWAMFRTFVSIYPHLHKPLAIAFLFIPSTVVWGSAVFKDTVCMFGLGWMTFTVFRIFINKDFSPKNLFMMVVSFYLIALVKIYILVAFVPALSIWLLVTFSKKIRSTAAQWFVNITTISLCVIGLFVLSKRFADQLGEYSLENIANTAKITQGYISSVSEEQGGSAYDLGDFEPTMAGMIVKFPQAVTVTLFRPFLWEAKKPIMLLSAIEALIFLILFVRVFFRRGFLTIVRKTLQDPNLLFFLIYSLIFAFAVGLSTGNFGTLSRYKIPCMPFFTAFLLIQYYHQKLASKPPVVITKNERKPVYHLS